MFPHHNFFIMKGEGQMDYVCVVIVNTSDRHRLFLWLKWWAVISGGDRLCHILSCGANSVNQTWLKQKSSKSRLKAVPGLLSTSFVSSICNPSSFHHSPSHKTGFYNMEKELAGFLQNLGMWEGISELGAKQFLQVDTSWDVYSTVVVLSHAQMTKGFIVLGN